MQPTVSNEFARKDGRQRASLAERARRAGQSRHGLLGAAALLSCACSHAANLSPMRAFATVERSTYTVENSVIAESFHVHDGHITGVRFTDKLHHRQIELNDAFTIRQLNGRSYPATLMRVMSMPSMEPLSAHPAATQQADRLAGKQVCSDLEIEGVAAEVRWCLVLRDQSRYLRQTLTVRSLDQPLPIEEVQLFNFKDADAHVSGSVAGSPVTHGTTFFGFEHPLSESTVRAGQVTLRIKRVLPLRPNQSITYSSVIGISDPGQMRRSFLTYVERERAHPYRSFLTYNSWYDLGYGERYGETGALDRIRAFGEELHRKRGVKLDSFLFDDGWDNPNSLWQFDAGFSDGFTRTRTAAAQYGAGIGVWLSPWGGYDQAKQERIAFGREHDYEIVKGGLALSGPRYFQAFTQICLKMIQQYGVNQFKFDGTGNADRVFAGSVYDSDFDAAIHLIDRLRQEQPNIFVNLTTGTYPSPFWLRYADSIWRGGEDHDFAGVGNWRQKWMTYRDAQTYKNIVKQGPLFPLNSLMLHGIIYAREAQHLDKDPGRDFADEVWSFFGSGTQMQEMYITPSLLSTQDWDVLADAARWSRANADILRDTHWIGGDPAALQVYGWAAWSRRKGIIVLRNPSDHEQQFTLNGQTVFELPVGAPHHFRIVRPDGSPVMLLAKTPHFITLRPFQVVTLEALH